MQELINNLQEVINEKQAKINEMLNAETETLQTANKIITGNWVMIDSNNKERYADAFNECHINKPVNTFEELREFFADRIEAGCAAGTKPEITNVYIGIEFNSWEDTPNVTAAYTMIEDTDEQEEITGYLTLKIGQE